LFDVLRTAHSLSVMVSQASLIVDPQGDRVEMQLFLKDSCNSKPLTGEDTLRPLLHQLRKAILLPIVVSVSPASDTSNATFDVHVFALPDAAGRGRPRVSLAIAAAMRKLMMQVEYSFVGIIDEQTALRRVPGPQLSALATTLSFPLLRVRVARHVCLEV
jgi:hypothetical protein